MTGIRRSDDLVHFIVTYYDSSKFWGELYDLQDDIDFFSAYIRRNKKSNFDFSLKFYNSYRTNFLNALWKNYEWVTDKDIIEWIYGLYIATNVIMNNFASVYDETDNNIYTTIPHGLIYEIMKLIYDCTGLDIADFVNSFISGFNICEKVKDALRELYYEYDNENLGGNKNE